jgi:hypothetical protein
MKFVALAILTTFVSLALPAASGMDVKAVADAVCNGTEISHGCGETPDGYMLVTDLKQVIKEAGYNVTIQTGSGNKYGLLYDFSKLSKISSVYELIATKDQDDQLIVPAPVMWFGGGSLMRLYINGAYHYIAVVKEQQNLIVLEYDLLWKEQIIRKYSTPLSRFKVFAKLPE